MSVCRSEVEFDGTVYKSAPDVAPTWEFRVEQGGFHAAAGVAKAKARWYMGTGGVAALAGAVRGF